MLFERKRMEHKLDHVIDVFGFPEESVMVWETEAGFDMNYEKVEEFIDGSHYAMLFIVCPGIRATNVIGISHRKTVRALEWMEYLLQGNGISKGDATVATGEISTAILNVYCAQMQVGNCTELFMLRIQQYFTQCEVVCNGRKVNQEEMKYYIKKQVPWAYVKTQDIAPAGEQIKIQTLENTTGVIVKSSPKTYVMIGFRGEVYDIQVDKFQISYTPGSESLDLFQSMLDFIPEVKRVETNEFVAIDELAHLCYPSKKVGIYARQLTSQTKVFAREKKEEYFVGRPGDYLAVREDDLGDVYIIKKEIFRETYERKEML